MLSVTFERVREIGLVETEPRSKTSKSLTLSISASVTDVRDSGFAICFKIAVDMLALLGGFWKGQARMQDTDDES